MRVITGSFRGKKLKSPEFSEFSEKQNLRPTSGMVKEGIFSAIQFEIAGKVIADLFAGTGQLGIEALSRGASKVYFTDNNPTSIAILKENLSLIDNNLNNFTEILNTPCTVFLKNLKNTDIFIDIAFLDPPYGYNHIQKTLPVLVSRMGDNGIIVCEHEKNCGLPKEIENFKIHKLYHYGKTGVTIYRKINCM